MVVSVPLLLLDLLSFLIWLDLFLVNSKRVHLYTPLLKYLPRSFAKTFQKPYTASLQRLFFCVLDKVLVNNVTTFNVIFMCLSLVNIIWNVLLMSQQSKTPVLAQIVSGVIYVSYGLACTHMYRSQREMCSYCRYGLVQGLISLWVMGQPLVMKWVIGVAVIGSVFVRGIARKQRRKDNMRKELKRKQDDQQEMMFDQFEQD